MAEEYVFEDAQQQKKSRLAEVGQFIWNSETKEFCGRDGASWGKVSLFYAVFYLFLGSFFVGMLAIFMAWMPRDRPAYYGEAGTIAIRGVNPGLGFRPQIDPEDSLILYSPKIKEAERYGFGKYVSNLNNFLNAKYSPQGSDVIKCDQGVDYSAQLDQGKSCEFDHISLFKSTECNAENNYGYMTNRPCVLIKLNKIISWRPKSANNSVLIKCEGDTSVDKDNLKKAYYHSEDSINSTTGGAISSKYYPYFAQKSYRAPFVWVQFELTPNVLVNIDCKAYADNIDNTDRLNRRGQTKFSLKITTK